MANPPGGHRPGGQRLSGLKAKSVKSPHKRETERERQRERDREREREPFVLRTYIVGGKGEKKLHID